MLDSSDTIEQEVILKRDWRFPAYERVKGRLFHRTTCLGLNGILSSGEIRPNIGSFPLSFPRSRVSYGFRNACISLFDFEDTSEAEQIQTFLIWNNLIGQMGKTFFLLTLNSQQLRPDLISSRLAPQPGQPNYGGCMRPIESWCPHPISLDLVQELVVVSYTDAQPAICSFELPEIYKALDRCLL
jgi:hypothetical protein